MRSVNELLEGRASHPGTSRLRAALAVDDLGSDRTKSELERRFLRLARAGELPMPRVNDWVFIPGEEMQCDFVWHRERLIVEVDGWETHRTRKAFRDDRRRDQLLRVAGWDVLRFTNPDVEDDPDRVVNTTLTLLARRLSRS
jgi:very-short-patch-repair endonuclease